jgi:hypothetical protein
MMSHVLALPTPAARSVERALVRIGAPVGTWSVYHVLYADCPCSRRVADALLRRGAREDFAERVLLVGRDQALSQRLAAARYAVEVLTSEALKEQFGVEAAPVFFAVAPDGSVPYLGGYSDFKQGPEQDDRILTSLRLGRRQDPLPVFGCAVSRELQAKADPLGLKYAVEATP